MIHSVKKRFGSSFVIGVSDASCMTLLRLKMASEAVSSSRFASVIELPIGFRTVRSAFKLRNCEYAMSSCLSCKSKALPNVIDLMLFGVMVFSQSSL